MLRLPVTHPGHLFASLPGSTLPSSVRVSQLALPEGRRVLSGPGSLFNRRPELPVYSHVDASGISQVSRRSILCLCLGLRPRPNRRSLAYLTVSSMLPPLFPRQGLQRLMNFGALSRGFSTCCLRFKSGVATIHAKLASGWLARLYREGVEPSGSLQKVSDHISRPPFLDLSWRKGSFIVTPPSRAGSLDHLVGQRDHCWRRRQAERRRGLEIEPQLELGRLSFIGWDGLPNFCAGHAAYFV